jgi:hypothetical protein
MTSAMRTTPFTQPTMNGQIEEHAVVVVSRDMKQEVVPKIKMLPLSYGESGGQEREPKEKQYPRLLPKMSS